MDRPHWSDGTAGQMDGEAGWLTTIGKIGLYPLARVKRVGRQQKVWKKYAYICERMQEVGREACDDGFNGTAREREHVRIN